MFVEKLSGFIYTITGGMVSLGPPVGTIVDAHLVSSAAPNNSTIATEMNFVILVVISRVLLIFFIL
jgi:hypothetical protein